MTRIEEIEARKAEIMTAVDVEGADINALEEEVRSLNAEVETIKAEAEKRQAIRDAVANGGGVVIEKIEERKDNNTMENTEKRITVDSAEYRNAFYTYLATGAAEARSTLIAVDSASTAGAGDAIAIPKTLDEKIWDNIHSEHPILADITTVASGIALEVTKHTAIASRVSGKKDVAQGAGAEDNTFVKVTLYGTDYEKYVELTYAEAKMSQGALENYLAQEIAAELGEALAGDVFTQIKSDAGNAQTLSGAVPTFAEVSALLGAASRAVNPVIYCSAAKYYALFGQVDNNGQPIFRDGVAVGATVKIDSAAGNDYICVDPAKFVLNEVAPVTIESDRDIKNHHVVISGYMRAQGTMRDNGAASWC